MSWKSWPIGLKLAAGFGAVTLVFLIAIGLALREAGNAQDRWAGTSRSSSRENTVSGFVTSRSTAVSWNAALTSGPGMAPISW